MEGSEGQTYIKQSVILNYQVCRDKTSGGCYIPMHCPRLPANVTATLSPPIGRMDSAICDERAWWGVCGRHRDGQTSVRARLPPVPARLSHHAAPPRVAATHGGLSGAGTRTDGRPSMQRPSLIASVRLHTKTMLLQYYEQFHAVTK